MLPSQLRKLEADKLIERILEAVIPPRVDYFLTAKGKSLLPFISLLGDDRLECGIAKKAAATLQI